MIPLLSKQNIQILLSGILEWMATRVELQGWHNIKLIISKLLISWLYHSYESSGKVISKWIANSQPSNFYDFQQTWVFELQ